jgi:hypothetical protein
MISLFLRAKSRLSNTPSPHTVADKDTDTSNPEPQTMPPEKVLNFTPNGEAGEISSQLSVIIANAEFLETLYGENQYLENILIAADKATESLGYKLHVEKT